MNSKQMTSLVTKGDRVGIVHEKGGDQINIKGGQKAQQAVRALSHFGLISFSRDQYFKSSTYSIHFIKPVAKLRQLYNLGDEVLILCCNDSLMNYKSRTKDLINYLLGSQSEYRNRLDKVTCFLVDDCKDIEEIIQRDRIENPDARLIIPFSYDELYDEITSEKLQNRMRTFLYERDLFGVASPLQDDNLFFGKDRFNIISELYGKYLQGEHGGLFGLRRSGKTSILNLLRCRVEQNSGAAIYFDCTKYHHLRWNSFLHQIIREIKDKYTYESTETQDISLPPDFTLDEAGSRYTEARAPISFEEDLKRLHIGLNGRRILLIFDEIEQISYTTSPSKDWGDGRDALFFWQTMRAISQTNNRIFSFIITGVNPKCIEDSKIDNQPNPIFNVLVPQYITLFDYNDVKNMVSGIGGHLGLQFEEELYARLIDDYGGHPFLTRQVCSKINADILGKKEPRPFKVSKYLYEIQAHEYQAKMETIIEQILGVLEDFYPSEYDLLKILALDGNEYFKKNLRFGDNSVSHLLGYCLIEHVQSNYFIRIKTIATYLKEKHKYEQTLNDTPEKRARISMRRGSIEEKLRSLIQARLVMKYGRKAKDHLIEIAATTTKDKTQQEKLRKKDLKNAMEELYFSQLKILMLKDWSGYQEIFSDRNKFEQFFDIINQYRVDAHSKTIDEEDEALLNMAFRFFERNLEDI